MLICKRLRHTSTFSGILKTRHNHTTTTNLLTTPHSTPLSHPANISPHSQIATNSTPAPFLTPLSACVGVRFYCTAESSTTQPSPETTTDDEDTFLVDLIPDTPKKATKTHTLRGVMPGETRQDALLRLWKDQTPWAMIPPPPALPLQEVPTSVPCNQWIRAFGEYKMWDQVEAVRKFMQDAAVPPSSRTYSTLVTMYSKEGRTMAVDELVREMDEAGFERTPGVLRTLLVHYSRLPARDQLLRFWDEFKECRDAEQNEREIRSTKVTISKLLSRFRKDSMNQQIQEVWHFLKGSGIDIDSELISCLEHAFRATKELKLLDELRRVVAERGVEHFPLWAMVVLFSAKPAQLKAVWTHMKQCGKIQGSKITSLYARHLIKVVPYDDLPAIQELITANAIPLNKYIVTELLIRYCSALDEVKILEVLQEAVESDIMFDKGSPVLIAKCYLAASPADVKSALPTLRYIWTSLQNNKFGLASERDFLEVWRRLVSAFGAHGGWDDVREMAEWVLGHQKDNLLKTEGDQQRILRHLMHVYACGGKAEETAHVFNYLLTSLLENRTEGDGDATPAMMTGADAYDLLYAHAKADQMDTLKELWKYCQEQCNLSGLDVCRLINLFAVAGLLTQLAEMLSLLAGLQPSLLLEWRSSLGAGQEGGDSVEFVSKAAEQWAQDDVAAQEATKYWADKTARFFLVPPEAPSLQD